MKSGQESELNYNTSRQGIQELSLIPEMFYISIRTLKKFILDSNSHYNTGQSNSGLVFFLQKMRCYTDNFAIILRLIKLHM